MMNDVEASLAIIFAVSEDRQLTGSLICAPALLRIFAAAVPIGEEPRPCDKVVSVGGDPTRQVTGPVVTP